MAARGWIVLRRVNRCTGCDKCVLPEHAALGRVRNIDRINRGARNVPGGGGARSHRTAARVRLIPRDTAARVKKLSVLCQAWLLLK